MATFHVLYAQVLTHRWLGDDDSPRGGYHVLHDARGRFGLGVMVGD